MQVETHEQIARNLKNLGNNCSASLYGAFSTEYELDEAYPAPRSIEGKCGALLTAQMILRKTGHENQVEDFEKEFESRFRYTKCVDLMTFERRCNDYVGESAKMLDEILEK